MVEFVSYNGKFPNLCRGTFVVKINGEIVKFGHDCLSWHTTQDENGNWSCYYEGEQDDPHYESFWTSGGCIVDNGERDLEAVEGEWELSYNHKNYPKEIVDLMPQFIEVFNENVPEGCCGGCI